MYTVKNPEDFGRLVGFAERALSRLAMYACNGVVAKKYEPQDAKEILSTFLTARYKARGEARRSEAPHKVQVSKLKQVMQVGDVFGAAGADMIELACDLHMSEFQKEKYTGRLSYVGEYNLMLDVAREALARGKLLSRNDIVKLVTIP